MCIYRKKIKIQYTILSLNQVEIIYLKQIMLFSVKDRAVDSFD